MNPFRSLLGLLAVIFATGISVGLLSAVLKLPTIVMIVLTVVFATAGCVYLFRRESIAEKRRVDSKQLAKAPTQEVRFDDTGVVLLIDGVARERVAWADLITVGIRIEETGFIVGPWWLLFGRSGAMSCPGWALGTAELLAEFQRRLPGFDNAGVVRAMGMMEGGVVVWQRATDAAQA